MHMLAQRLSEGGAQEEGRVGGLGSKLLNLQHCPHTSSSPASWTATSGLIGCHSLFDALPGPSPAIAMPILPSTMEESYPSTSYSGFQYPYGAYFAPPAPQHPGPQPLYYYQQPQQLQGRGYKQQQPAFHRGQRRHTQAQHQRQHGGVPSLSQLRQQNQRRARRHFKGRSARAWAPRSSPPAGHLRGWDPRRTHPVLLQPAASPSQPSDLPSSGTPGPTPRTAPRAPDNSASFLATTGEQRSAFFSWRQEPWSLLLPPMLLLPWPWPTFCPAHTDSPSAVLSSPRRSSLACRGQLPQRHAQPLPGRHRVEARVSAKC